MPKIELTKDQLKSLREVLDYIFEHETVDFADNHLDEDFSGSLKEWNEIDKQIIAKKIRVPHIYCSAVRVQDALK